MILVTNNEGTLGVPTTARMLADGAGGWTPSRPAFG